MPKTKPKTDPAPVTKLPGTPQPPEAPAQPETVQVRGLTPPIFSRVLRALDTCPHGEVRDLVVELHNTPTINVAIK